MAQSYVWSSNRINAEELASLYEWLDRVPLSRPRTSVEKDFADGCMAAEVVKFYFPSFVDLRDYQPSPNIQDRLAQWKMLNVRVFRRIGLIVPSHMATQLAICKTGIAQILLSNLRACLTMAGANTYGVRSKSVMQTRYIPGRPPRVPRRGEMPVAIVNNPYVYVDPYEYGYPTPPKTRGGTRAPKSISNPDLMPPAVSRRYPQGFLPPVQGGRKNANPDEVLYLRSQVRRMEALLQAKNAKIYDLQDEIAVGRRQRQPVFRP